MNFCKKLFPKLFLSVHYMLRYVVGIGPEKKCAYAQSIYTPVEKFIINFDHDKDDDDNKKLSLFRFFVIILKL